MNSIMQESLIVFMRKIDFWEHSFPNCEKYNFIDFIEEFRLEDREYHYWTFGNHRYAKYFCGIIFPTAIWKEIENVLYDMGAFFESNDAGYSFFMFTIFDEKELDKVAKIIYNFIGEGKIKHMLLCSGGDILDEL